MTAGGTHTSTSALRYSLSSLTTPDEFDMAASLARQTNGATVVRAFSSNCTVAHSAHSVPHLHHLRFRLVVGDAKARPVAIPPSLITWA